MLPSTNVTNKCINKNSTPKEKQQNISKVFITKEKDEFADLEGELIQLKSEIKAMYDIIVELKRENENFKKTVEELRNENIVLNTNIKSTTPAEIDNMINNLYKTELKLKDTIELRLTNSNRNVNLLQLENKQLRASTQTIEENKKSIENNLQTLKERINIVEKVTESNRQRIIDIDTLRK